MEDKTGQAPNRSPPIDTRDGAKERDGVEAGSKPIRDDDGRKRDEVSRHAGDGITTPSPDAHGSHGQDDGTTPPLSTHHIDTADSTK